MKSLVLGSSGQIGSELVEYLSEMGDKVILHDIIRSPEDDLRIIAQKNENLINNIHEADFIYFLAFDVGGSRYLKQYQNTYEFISNNIRIMQNTFEVLKWMKKPFIFASSQMSNMCSSPYGVLKSIGESYTKALGGLVVKFWNVYGYERDLNKSHVITDLILKGLKEGAIHVQSDGKESRQFLYSLDASRALKIVADNYDKISRNDELHITSFEWLTIAQLAIAISKKLGNLPISFAPDRDVIQDGYHNEPNRYILDFWQPEISLEQGIQILTDKYAKLYK